MSYFKTSSLKLGMEVVAITKEHEIVLTGTLNNVSKIRGYQLIADIGGEKVHVNEYGNSLTIIGRAEFDQEVHEKMLYEYSDLVCKSVQYFSNQLKPGQRDLLLSHLNAINEIMAQKVSQNNTTKGLSYESYQAMNGNKSLTLDDIRKEVITRILDRCKRGQETLIGELIE